jgi:hypothetical protein
MHVTATRFLNYAKLPSFELDAKNNDAMFPRTAFKSNSYIINMFVKCHNSIK